MATAIAEPPVQTKPAAAEKPMKQPPAVQKKVEAKPEPTATEQESLTESVGKLSGKKFAGMPWKKGDAKTDDKKPETKVVEDEKKPTEKAETKETKPDAKDDKKEEKKPVLRPKAEKPVKPEVDLEKLVKATVEATAQAVRPKEVAKPSQADEVPDARREEWISIQKAEEGKAAHKGAAAAALKVFKAEGDYIQKWQQDHPGDTYDPNADEHDQWYKKNMPDWMESAAEHGEKLSERERIEKEVEERLAKRYEPMNQKLTELEMRDVQRDVERTAPQTVNQGIAIAINTLNPELLKEGVKIDETDPVAHEVMMRFGPQISAESQAALMLFATRGASIKEGDPLREKIIAATNDMEAEILKASDEDRTAPDGRTFIALDKWANLSDAEKSKHWTITGEIVAVRLANKTAQEAKKIYDLEINRLEKLAKARGWTSNGATDKTHGEVKPEPEEVIEDDVKPRSPSTAAKTVINPGTSTDAKVCADWTNRWASKKFGR